MAFASAVVEETVFGNKRVVIGTFASSSSGTGGDITTGLTNCDAFFLQPKGSAVTANESVVNETFPLAGGVVTIVTDADLTGTFMAIGY